MCFQTVLMKTEIATLISLQKSHVQEYTNKTKVRNHRLKTDLFCRNNHAENN
jgi:hypothetical protein